MAKAMIDDATLTSIADAIRAKTDGTAALKPSEMPAAIAGIQTGSDGLALPDTIVAGDTPVMISKGGKSITSTEQTDAGLTMTMPKTGTYRFLVCASVAGAAVTAHLLKNGEDAGYVTIGASPTDPASMDLECNAGDVITLTAAKGSGYFAYLSVFALIACVDWNNGFGGTQ